MGESLADPIRDAWAGTMLLLTVSGLQARTWSMDGNRLTLVTDRAPSMRDPSKMATAKLTFEKID